MQSTPFSLQSDPGLYNYQKDRTNQVSNIPGLKSHIHIPLFRLFIQRIRQSLNLIMNIHKNLIFYGERLLAPAKPPLVVWPRLFIHFILIYPP
jgi:hypothetical protein